jgi:hypothetical protein
MAWALCCDGQVAINGASIFDQSITSTYGVYSLTFLAPPTSTKIEFVLPVAPKARLFLDDTFLLCQVGCPDGQPTDTRAAPARFKKQPLSLSESILFLCQ